MAYDRQKFFDAIRKSIAGGSLEQEQVDGFEILLKEAEKRGVNAEWTAYILATVWHETAATMQPVRETLLKTDAAAIKALDKAWAAGKLGSVSKPYWRDGWFGRGYIQLTHKHNYQKMGDWLNVDLVGDPSKAMDPEIASQIAFEGMLRGMFTTKKLSTYLDGVDEADAEDEREFIAARAVINGKDKAKKIAAHALKFETALRHSEVANVTKVETVEKPAGPKKPPVKETVKTEEPVVLGPAPQNTTKPAVKSTTIWSSIAALITSAFAILGGLHPLVQVFLLGLIALFVGFIIWQRMKVNSNIEGLF